jgi:cyclase
MTLITPQKLILLAALAFVLPASAETKLKQIVPGVWFHAGMCNTVIIEMKDYLVVVDSSMEQGARDTAAEAKNISSKPVKCVLLTHHHADHTAGNAFWTKAGAVTVAFPGVVEEMKRGAKEELPKQIVSGDLFTLDDGQRRIEFHYFGYAHTRGDGWVYLPKEKVLCTGDAVLNGPMNYTVNANLKNWPGVIRRAEQLDVEYVLPGHGNPAGKELLERQAQFLIELRGAVEKAVQDGKKLEDLVTLKDGKPVATSLRLPDSVKFFVSDMLYAMQVKDAYEEIAQGKPRGDL